MKNEAAPKPIKSEGVASTPETKSAENQNQTNRRRGAKLLELRESLAAAYENDEDSEVEEKIEFLLEESKFQEPSIHDFTGKQVYYTRQSARSDEAYVKKKEQSFTEDKRLAKAAEAITGITIQNDELFPSVGDIRTVVINPVTRYDDIANGIDQAVTIITTEGDTKPFGFDVTIGSSRDTFIKKLFRPYRDTHGDELDIIGLSRLKYGQEPSLDENGDYVDVESKTVDPIPRLALVFSEDEVIEMADAVTLERGFDESEIDVYTNPKSETILHNALQFYEQAVFFGKASEVNLQEINSKLKKETEPSKKARLEKQAELLKKQLAQYKELEKTLKPVLEDAYKRARKETISNPKDAKPDWRIRQKLLCTGYIGTPTGQLIDILHEFEGYKDVYGDRRNQKEAELIDAYIEQAMDEYSKEYHRRNPHDNFEPSYTADQIAKFEFDATIRARQQMLNRCSHYMSDRLARGAEEYEEIEERRRKAAGIV